MSRLLYPDIVLPLLVFSAAVATENPFFVIGACAFCAWAWITALWEK